MRKALGFLSASLVLCLNCFGQSESAATNAAPPSIRLFDHIKLIPDFVRPAKSSLAGFHKPRKHIVMMSQARPSNGGPCAHIILKSPPPDLDPKIIRKVPEGFVDNIAKDGALRQCLQDLR